MRQILQNLKSGATEVVDVPCPRPGRGEVLVRTSRTLISAGTERMLLEFGRAGWIEKARQQPDRVRQVVEKMKTDGLVATAQAVMNKLDQPLPLGYCNAGVVVEVGEGVTAFAVGDRIACNGRHAEMVSVPVNLCARIPDAVSDEAAAFTVAGAIALQGIRLAQPTLGEAIVVTGLGLIGQLTVQLLRAQGCRVVGIDRDAARLALARQAGADVVDLNGAADPIRAAAAFSRGRGVDAVLITAATESSEPVQQAASMCRKRGRIVLVGVTGLNLSRDEFFKKELTFQVSCSYGPGRYDPDYEEKGQDYPVGFVRWTEQRNFEAVLDALADARLNTAALVTHRFVLDRAGEAYDVVGGSEPSMGIVIEYPTPPRSEALRQARVDLPLMPSHTERTGSAGLAVIGTGAYATGVLIPAFKSAGARLVTVASRTGVSAVHAGRKFGFRDASTDLEALLADREVDAVAIATRHDTHAALASAALRAGKAVFVEKPLCLTLDELAAIEAAHQDAPRPLLMVGFNRRFAPHVVAVKAMLGGMAEPKAFVMTINAGSVPADHWTRDPRSGGGRVIGEACHFVDLLRFLAGSPIAGYDRSTLPGGGGDTTTMQLRFEDGSIGTIHYFANGSKAFPKERLEVFAQGRVVQIDNFRKLRAFGWPGAPRMNLWRQDKGQRACAAAFLAAIRNGGPAPIPFAEISEVSRVTIALGS